MIYVCMYDNLSQEKVIWNVYSYSRRNPDLMLDVCIGT